MKPRLLLVEDDPNDVFFFEECLARVDADRALEVARDGDEALACLRRWVSQEPRAPLLVVLDLKLPRCSGLQVLRAMRASRELAAVPVFVLTSSAETEDVAGATALGVVAYRVKPVGLPQLLAIVREICALCPALVPG